MAPRDGAVGEAEVDVLGFPNDHWPPYWYDLSLIVAFDDMQLKAFVFEARDSTSFIDDARWNSGWRWHVLPVGCCFLSRVLKVIPPITALAERATEGS
jgi:hypothetical protein